MKVPSGILSYAMGWVIMDRTQSSLIDFKQNSDNMKATKYNIIACTTQHKHITCQPMTMSVYHFLLEVHFSMNLAGTSRIAEIR